MDELKNIMEITQNRSAHYLLGASRMFKRTKRERNNKKN